MSRPDRLRGLRVAVTREAGRGASLAALLEARGARVLICPAIRTERISRPRGLGRVRAGLSSYDWIVFTSGAGAEAFFSLVPSGALAGRTRVAVIGPGTAATLRRVTGRVPDLVPPVQVAESLLRAFGPVRGRRFLIPRAAVAREMLPGRLRFRGARVTVLKVYRTRPDRTGVKRLRKAAVAGRVAAATFTSASTVDFSMRGIGAAGRSAFAGGRVAAFSIGPITSAALRRWRIRPAAEARPHTVAGLAAALAGYYGKRRAARRMIGKAREAARKRSQP